MAVIRFIGPRRKWARARCMGMTPPRCPRVRTVSVNFKASGPMAATSRRSKLPEESNARSTSLVKGAVIVISHQIQAPVCAYPLAPGSSERLTLEIVQGLCGPNQLIRLHAKTGANRNVVLLVSSLGHGHKTGRRED